MRSSPERDPVRANAFGPGDGPSREPRVRLAFGATLWRVTLVCLVLLELVLLARVHQRLPRGARLVRFLIYTPRVAFLAFLIGAVTAILGDLLVRLVVQPAVRAWYHPRTDGSTRAFHIAPGESALASTPARRGRGLSWGAGDLVLTDRRLWFFPRDWSAEPWSWPLAGTTAARVPAPRAAWGFLAGVPDGVRIEGGPDRAATFAVADPEAVLAWFDPTARAPEPG